MTSKIVGFGSEFIEQPPTYLQSECPICLLILRDPYQVTCCGKSFCEPCIQGMKDKDQPCPTCKKEKFDYFPNLGLKQPLYSFSVYCCNKAKGCDWQGELGQLDQHLNLNPDEDKQLIGCPFAEIQCLYCEVYERRLLEKHQLSECLKRPFTCSMCKTYKSTYGDVSYHHAPVCECRPVECPNTCGYDNLQHQHLEEHLSSVCPLSLVQCEFSHAGCGGEVYRKDLTSHLSDSLVIHISLLARESRDQKLQLKKQNHEMTVQKKEIKDQAEEIKKLTQTVVKQAEEMAEREAKIKAEVLKYISRSLPLKVSFHAESNFCSEPFYSSTGHKLELEVEYLESNKTSHFSYNVIESEFKVRSPCTLSITALLLDQAHNKNHREYTQDIDYPQTDVYQCLRPTISRNSIFLKNNRFTFYIKGVQIYMN